MAQIDGGALSKLTPVKVPEAYKSPLGRIVPNNAPTIKGSTGPYSGTYWIVYSDRDNNQTYKDKNLTQPFNSVNFKEIFIVADQTDKALRLVEYDPANAAVDEAKGKSFFTAVAKDAGWVNKKNVLLWSVSLVDSVNTYARKAVSIKKLSEMNDLTSIIERGIVKIYDDPGKQHLNDKDIKLFQYLFIYKEENDMFLVGNNNVMKPSTVPYNLYGWVAKSQLQEWSSALCLRVNFDPVAVSERDKNNIEPCFMRNEENAISYKEGKDHKCMIFNFDDPTDGKKDNPYLLGYPIIASSKRDATVFKTGYVTNIVDRNGRNVFTAMQGADQNRTFEKVKNEKEKINIVFVYDGADRNSYKSLCSAIDANTNIGNKVATNNDYKLGAVIYNDLACGEDLAFVKIPFKSSKDIFIESLKAKMDGSPACDISRATAAPLTQSIKMACDFFDNGKTTNIIIVIGTVTDNDDTKKEISLNALITKNVQMVMYQTTNKGGRYYDNFTRNAKFYLESMSAAADDPFKKQIEKGTRQKARFENQGEIARLLYSSIIGESYYKDEGRQFTERDFSNSLKRLLLKIEENINQSKAIFEQTSVGTGKGLTSANLSEEEESRMKEFQSWLLDEGVTSDVLQKLSTMNNYQIFVEGYTALKPKSAVNQIFERNLFVSDKEFISLYTNIEKVADAFSATERRKAVLQAFTEIIFTYKGPIDEKTKERYTPDEIYSLITKLSGATNNPSFKRSLREIADEKKVLNPEIDEMYQGFKRVEERLKKLKKDNNSQYYQDDQCFYWVPESVLTID